jgi:hypothetical protein
MKMDDLKLGDIKKIYCNTCKIETNHELKGTHHKEYDNDYGWEITNYHFWICLGCETATLEEAFTAMGLIDIDNNQIWEFVYYPKRKTGDLNIKRFRNLPSKLSDIYRETIACFNINSPLLCTIGLRALLEGICANKKISGHNLKQKIEGLKKLLPANIVDNLHSFRFMGNDAAHELNPPNNNELKIAIEVVEDLLNFIYDLEYKTEELLNKSKKKNFDNCLSES